MMATCPLDSAAHSAPGILFSADVFTIASCKTLQKTVGDSAKDFPKFSQMFCPVLYFEVYMFRDPSTPVFKQLFSENGDIPDLQDSNPPQNIKALAMPYSILFKFINFPKDWISMDFAQFH